jgi:hypothetical protein
MLSAVRVKILTHSNGTIKLQTNLASLTEVTSTKTKNLASVRTGTGAGHRLLSGGCNISRQRSVG